MTDYGVAIVFAVFVWWFSTGIVLYAVRLPRFTVRWTILAASILLVAAVYGLAVDSRDDSVPGVFAAFTFTIFAWGWVEVTFLTGVLTGPRPLPCPEPVTGARRIYYTIQAILYHEIALLAVGGLVVLMTWGGVNRIGASTYALLWVLRLSAKLNLFLGVPVLNASLLPSRIRFIETYFRERPMNPFFPVSVTFGTVAFVMLAVQASVEDASASQRAGCTLLATLMALAVLEHWFMVIPAPLAAAWGWSLKSSRNHAGEKGAPPRTPRRAEFRTDLAAAAPPESLLALPTEPQTSRARQQALPLRAEAAAIFTGRPGLIGDRL
jgi:putative photosynthetic complex assembly protein 2